MRNRSKPAMTSSPPTPLLLLLLYITLTLSTAAPSHAPNAGVHHDDSGKTVFKDPNGNVVTYDPKSSGHFRWPSRVRNSNENLLIILQPCAFNLLFCPATSASSSFTLRRRYCAQVHKHCRVLRDSSLAGTALTGFQARETFQLGRFRCLACDCVCNGVLCIFSPSDYFAAAAAAL
jgi:hypothetical protein